MWFQKDGATCHIARITIDLLRGELGEHFDRELTPLDYFLWGYAKAHVYTDRFN